MIERVAFVVDGARDPRVRALDQATGGYLYDRIVVAGLRARGLVVEVVELSPRAGDLARESARLARLVRAAGPRDAIVVDELSHPRAVLASLAHALGPRRASLVALVHHLAASERTGAAARARLLLELPLLRVADVLIATSETTRDVLARAGVPLERVAVARPGRDRLGEHLAPRDASSAPARLLFVGAVTPRKDVLGLVRAFARVREPAGLTIAGPLDRDAHYVDVIRRASAGDARIELLGEVSDARLAELYRASDALVLPSRYEGFGIAIAEALAHGLAIVATRAGAIGEVARDGREALLVAPGDEAELARALRAIVADAELRARMQRDARERALALPSWRDTIDAFARGLTGI